MNNEVKEKKGVNIIVVIIISIIMLILGTLIGVFVIGNKEEKEVKTSKVKDITNTDLAKKLEEFLISKDKTQGLYYDEKISSVYESNIELLKFGLKDYFFENNIDVSKNEQSNINDSSTYLQYDDVATLAYKIDRKTIDNHLNKMFNNDVVYDFGILDIYSVKNLVYYDGIFDIRADKENYYVVWGARGGGDQKVKNKLVKAEQDGDYIYLYDKAAVCYDEVGSMGCAKSMDDMTYEHSVIECTVDDNGEYTNHYAKDNYCSNLKEYTIDTVSDYTLANLSDKLNTYKHIFKKSKDGNYYWLSSEIDK